MKNSGFPIKKLVLGVVVVTAFIVYSIIARHNNAKSIATTSSTGDSGSTSTVTPSSGSSTTTPPATSPTSSTSSSSGFKDGTFTGSVEDAFYGNVQVSAVISGGKLVQVNLLQYPSDNPHTQDVSNQSLPVLKQEAVQAQSASVDSVSGATDTSSAFMKSLAAALQQA